MSTTKNFVWLFNASSLASGLDGDFSREYHLAKGMLKTEPARLVDSRVWLIASIGKEKYLYGSLEIESVERYDDGKYAGDYLVKAKSLSSIRLLPRNESRSSWNLSGLNMAEELRECSANETTTLEEIVAKNFRTAFAPPTKKILNEIPRTKFKDPRRAAIDQLILVLGTTAFGDISRSQSFPSDLSAFGGLALSVIENFNPEIDLVEVRKILALIDPLPNASKSIPKAFRAESKTISIGVPPLVDTFLVELDPDKIVPRSFIARSKDHVFDWLQKLNQAEENHEMMLRDIVIELKGKRFETYKTNSFDLFTLKNNSKIVWELKSANSANLISQGEKGVIQLMRYQIGLAEDGIKDARCILLLQYVDQPLALEYIERMAQRIGAELWLYDSSRNWPDRIFRGDQSVFLG